MLLENNTATEIIVSLEEKKKYIRIKVILKALLVETKS